MSKKKQNKWVITAVEGLRVGLKAFVAAYIISLVLSLVINLSVLEELQDYLVGKLASGSGFSLATVTKTASILMNISVFNKTGNIQLGLLILAVIPLISFFIADRQDNLKEGMDFFGFAIYGIASGVFTGLLSVLSWLTAGEFLSMEVDFFSLQNGIMTFVITFLIQMAIGLNYNAHRLPGILATRWMLRLTIIFNGGLAIFGVIYGVSRVSTNISLMLIAALVLAPNIAVYIFFTMMGISIDFNEPLVKLMDYANFQVSYDMIPLSFRVVLLVIFAMFVAFSIARLDQENYLVEMVGFMASYPLISLLVAYATRINLGVVRGLMDVQFGISLASAFVYPLVGILLVGLLIVLFKQLFRIILGR